MGTKKNTIYSKIYLIYIVTCSEDKDEFNINYSSGL